MPQWQPGDIGSTGKTSTGRQPRRELCPLVWWIARDGRAGQGRGQRVCWGEKPRAANSRATQDASAVGRCLYLVPSFAASVGGIPPVMDETRQSCIPMKCGVIRMTTRRPIRIDIQTRPVAGDRYFALEERYTRVPPLLCLKDWGSLSRNFVRSRRLPT